MVTLCQTAPALPIGIVDKIVSNITMVSSGSRTSYYSNYVKKCSLIHLQAGHFFIVQLGKPLVLPTLQDAIAKIEVLKTSRKNDYFKGTFSKITKDYSIFEFETTLPASNATSSWFHVHVMECDVDSIAPPCATKITFNIDVCCVSETELDTYLKAVAEVKWITEFRDIVFRALDEHLDEPVSKSIKMELEEVLVVPIVPNLRKSKLNENARTSYILDRIKELAAEYTQLDVYDNKSALLYSPQRNFSKYSKSSPDLTALMNNVVIFNRVNHESLMVMAEEDVEEDVEVDVETVEEDATTILGTKMNVTVESKLNERGGRDPIGQVLAGIEKTYADILYYKLKTLKPDALLPTDVVMYGMYIIPETDQCIFLKAELKIGVDTLVYKSRESLSIVDAFNRVLTRLCQ